MDEFTRRITSRLYVEIGVCTRVDVLYDQYLDNSIKSGIRTKRPTTVCQVWTNITSRDLKLPFSWLNFIKINENKSNLAQFLSYELVKVVRLDDHRTILGGGSEDPMKVFSSNVENDVSHLRANRDEADTRILLHAHDACNQGYARLVIECRDTDVLLLLLVFAN